MGVEESIRRPSKHDELRTSPTPTTVESSPARWRGRSRGLRRPTWPTHLMLVVVVAVLVGPVLYAVLVSTQSNNDLFSFALLPGDRLDDNWDVVWNERQLGRFMLTSTVVSVIIAFGKVVTSLLAGLAFVYFRFPGKWVVFGFVLVTLLMPTEISILALFRQVSDLGWQEAGPWGLPPLGLTVPFFASATGAFLFRQHFANLPADLSEAAQIDGVTPFQFLFKILVPLSWNAIGALLVIQFIYGWNMYLWPLLLQPDNQLVQVGLGGLRNADQGQAYGPLMLGALLASIPPILVFLVLQKPFMRGMAIGRDK
jgi:sn-glycerol 3-phosphate transport system permease protein